MLFGVNTPGGPLNIVLKVGFDAPQRGGGEFLIMGPLSIFGTAKARDLKVCVHIEGWGPNENVQQ